MLITKLAKLYIPKFVNQSWFIFEFLYVIMLAKYFIMSSMSTKSN